MYVHKLRCKDEVILYFDCTTNLPKKGGGLCEAVLREGMRQVDLFDLCKNDSLAVLDCNLLLW